MRTVTIQVDEVKHETDLAFLFVIGGPQDGAKVRKSGGEEGHPPSLPGVLYVGPKWLGDGFAAWSDQPSKRFPAQYSRDERETGSFRFDYCVRPDAKV